MKTQKWIKLAFVALAAGVILQSCSKEEGLIPQDDLSVNPTFTVRPDFATLDTRPADVIAQFQVVETNPVKLDAAAKAGKYTLVIGISDYAGTANDLQYCDDDAMDWKAELQSEGYSVTSLLDGNATKAAIESAINTLASQSIAGNEIAFIYSGHGSKGNIIDAYKHFSSSKRLKEHHENLKNELYIFHNFEFLAILIVASIYSNIALLILIGAFFHYLLDWINEIWNIKKVKTLSFIAFVMKTKKRKKE